MAKPVIEVRNLGKKYRLGSISARTLREEVENWWRRGKEPSAAVSARDFMALRDISFRANPGDVVGIIGRNGAGKSTLLKILSRITEPTSGEAILRGRSASLLEVGTGFHPDLTGRENIYLNGTILGMKSAEITRKLDEIIAFAEIEKFLDTPVKRYSSGMYVRLAFAVAAHLDSEILIIDEVLAVGDAAFQGKCLRKMEGLRSHSDRTILFVSHNLAAHRQLCSRGIFLQNGEIAFDGRIDECLSSYYGSLTDSTREAERPTWAKSMITAVRILDAEGKSARRMPMKSNLTIEVDFADPSGAGLRVPVLGLVIHHKLRGEVGTVNTRMTGHHFPDGLSQGTLRCHLQKPPLLQGDYIVDIYLGDGPADVDVLHGAAAFTMLEADIYGSGHLPLSHIGTIFFEATWDDRPLG